MLFKKVKNKILRIGLNLFVYGLLGILLVFVFPFISILGLVIILVVAVGWLLIIAGVIINIFNYFNDKKQKNSNEYTADSLDNQSTSQY